MYTIKSSSKMNTTSIGNDNSYFECGSENRTTRLTPTVVSNFDLPNTNINTNGPYLRILEQPQTKFRFRYKSEMVGTHGQLKAESSDKNKNVFPTVKLCNWDKGLSLIRLMLYTADDNVNERQRHVHELNGKNCNKEGFTGGCEVIVDEENNYTAQFSNLGIIHIAKRDVQNIIFQRKKEELINQTCLNNPGLRNESIQHNIPPTKLQKLKEEAEEEGRKMDLNKVVLRFQAFYFDTKANFYRPITDCVDSDVILNLKNASTGELKIVRISAVSSPCTGGTEVWMLVERVKKNNVRIKFYEVDHNNQEIWKGYGVFKESDVHHQYAIVFRTPAYRNINIREPVHIKVQLERTPDNDTSEPVDFTFLPQSLKRQNISIESGFDSEANLSKRLRPSDIEPMNLQKQNLFLGQGECPPWSPETPNQSPSHMVPSPMTPAGSPSSRGFYSPPRKFSSNQPTIIITSNGEEQILASEPLYTQHQMNAPEMQQQLMMNGLDPQGPYINVPGDPSDPSYFYNSHPSPVHSLSPAHQVPSPGDGYGSPLTHSPMNSTSPSYVGQCVLGDESDNAFTQIQQFNAVQNQVINDNIKVQQGTQNWDFSDLLSNTLEPQPQDEDIDLLDIISNNKFFEASRNFSDIQADYAKTNGSVKPKTKNEKKNDVTEFDEISEKISKISVNEISNNKNQKKCDMAIDRVSLDSALTSADMIKAYSERGDVKPLLTQQRLILSAQNKDGENSLHISIRQKNRNAFLKILKAIVDLEGSNQALNAQNIYGQTPLHLAVISEDLETVSSLLLAPGLAIKKVDSDGNTVLHLALKISSATIFDAILAHSIDDERNQMSDIVNLYNYDGVVPLHMAVTKGCLHSVEKLVSCGAEVHSCERKRGSNPLHLAAMDGRIDIVKYLIENTDVAVDARMFDGNSALHIATQNNDLGICALLMTAKANPNIRNYLLKKEEEEEKKNEEEEEQEEQEEEKEISEEEGYTPLDYASENEKILAVLNSCQEAN